MLLFLVTPCLVVAVQPCIEWIPIRKKRFLWHGILTSSHFIANADKVMPWTETIISITQEWYFGNIDSFCELVHLKVIYWGYVSLVYRFLFLLIKLLRLTCFTNFILSPSSLFDNNFYFPFSCMRIKTLVRVLSLI